MYRSKSIPIAHSMDKLREQKRRENEWDEYLKSIEDNSNEDGSKNFQERNGRNTKQRGERIRIIRISDLCVSNAAWNLVTMITNIALSLVFRYQEKCEKLLEASSLVDSIVLRPGDLMEAERVSSIRRRSAHYGIRRCEEGCSLSSLMIPSLFFHRMLHQHLFKLIFPGRFHAIHQAM